MRLIGVDWAVDERNRGVAVVDCVGDTTSIVGLWSCNARLTALKVICEAITTTSAQCVIAVDAPLGWPAGLSQALSHHQAGDCLEVHANEMFSRETDRFIRDAIRKRPLEVGANLIARTAHSANQFLHALREALSHAVPLLWSPVDLAKLGVIEVYPAATKIAVGNTSAAEILGLQSAKLTFATAHVSDALWCTVAAFHFIQGECYPPTDAISSRREGWIWVKRMVPKSEDEM